jgi:hypothetical protein
MFPSPSLYWSRNGTTLFKMYLLKVQHAKIVNSNSLLNLILCDKTSRHCVENHCTIYTAVKYIFLIRTPELTR